MKAWKTSVTFYGDRGKTEELHAYLVEHTNIRAIGADLGIKVLFTGRIVELADVQTDDSFSMVQVDNCIPSVNLWNVVLLRKYPGVKMDYRSLQDNVAIKSTSNRYYPENYRMKLLMDETDTWEEMYSVGIAPILFRANEVLGTKCISFEELSQYAKKDPRIQLEKIQSEA